MAGLRSPLRRVLWARAGVFRGVLGVYGCPMFASALCEQTWEAVLLRANSCGFAATGITAAVPSRDARRRERSNDYHEQHGYKTLARQDGLLDHLAAKTLPVYQVFTLPRWLTASWRPSAHPRFAPPSRWWQSGAAAHTPSARGSPPRPALRPACHGSEWERSWWLR